MKKMYLLLVVCCYLLSSQLLTAQTNIIVNPHLEDLACPESGSPCAHINSCLPGWRTIHGSPNWVRTECVTPGPAISDHHVQMVATHDVGDIARSEGILQDINLEPGCYQMFISARVQQIEAGTTARLRIALDHDVQPWDSNFNCQESPPFTNHTNVIHDAPINPNGNWHREVIDFGITEETSFLDELMVSATVSFEGRATVWVDCIYIYPLCEDDQVNFVAVNSDLTIPNGIHNACEMSFIGSTPTTQTIANGEVEIYAGEMIYMLPNFHAKANFRAALADACTNAANRLDPECGCADFCVLRPEECGEQYRVAQVDAVTLFPNPASDHFEMKLPGGIQEVKIFDSKGALLYHDQHSRYAYINTANWSKGIYIIRVTHTETLESSTNKLVIQ